MDFGLGLVLSFTDNATAGINNAVNSLSQLTSVAEGASTSLNQMASLSALSVVADRLGSSFLSAGQTILSTLGQVVSKINDVGSTVFYAENKLGKLYEGTGKTGKDVMGEIATYAQQSIFEYEDLIDVVAMLKANGIEAFDDIASSTGNSNQKLMDYAADLAAFNPQMKNAYGTGIKAAMGALNEYIAEGNAMSLKRGASIDITGILGEDKGSTMEERSRQVADLMEKLNLVGMTASMAGTPMQRLSNVQDMIFTTISRIADSGVYEKFTNIIAKVTDWIFNLNEAEEGQVSIIDRLVPVIADTITSIMTPIEKFIDKVLELGQGLAELLANNPALLKMGTILVAIGGVLAVVIGVVLKVTSAFSGLSLMMLSMGKTFGSIGGLIKTGMLKIMSTLIPLTATIGLMYLAWKNDFAGIRTNVTYFVSNLANSFNTARNAVNGSVEDLKTTLAKLNSKNDFFSNLTIGLMKVMVLFKALAEGWNDYTLSEDTFLKAKELGILPLIEAILDFKYRFDNFKQGFIDGWREIGNKVATIVGGLLNTFDGTILDTAITKLTDFFQSLTNNDAQAWYDFGQSFADFTAKALVFFGALSMFKKVSGIFSGITKVVSPLIGLIVAHPIVALIVGIITALGILYAKSETFRDLVNSVFGQLKQVATEALASIMPLILNVVESVKQFLPQLLQAFQRIGEAVAPIIQNVMSLIMQILPVVGEVIGSVVNVIISLMPTIMNVITTVANILATVFEVVSDLMDLVVPFLVDIISQVGSLISDILPVLADLIANVVDAVMNVVNLVLPMIKSVIEALMPIIKTIMNIVSSIVAKLVPVIKSVVSIVSNIIKMIIDIITPIITVIVQVVQAIIQVLAPIVDVIVQAVGFIIDVILGIVQVVMSVIEAIVAVISGIVNVIMSIINVIVQIVMSVVGVIVGIVTTIIETVTSIISGIIAVIQGIWDFMVNTFSNAVSFFSGIFTSVFEVISGIFNNIADFFTTVWNGIVTAFTTIGDVISGAIKGAINTVLSGAVGIINGFIKAINFAIGVINAIPGVEISKLTELSVPQLAQGGVVDRPTTALIGEAGTEAVVPLENNTEWLGKLAVMLTNEISKVKTSNLVPTNNVTNNSNTTNAGGDSQYMTSTTTNNNQTSGDTDNSITFAEGAIQLTVQNASEEEALRLAKFIMEYIQRQKELKGMAQYN